MAGRIVARLRLPIVLQPSPGEIARRDRACCSGVEKPHCQVLWLPTRTPTPPAPAEAVTRVGRSPARVRTILKWSNAEWPAGLADRRRATNGARPRLSAEQKAPLFEALQGRSDDGGLWTGPKAAAYGARSQPGPASGPVACPSGRQTARASLSSPRLPADEIRTRAD